MKALKAVFASSLLSLSVTAFPFLAGLDPDILAHESLDKRQSSCPYNSNHQGAAPITSQYPYNGAKYPVLGKGVGGYQVPAPGDTAHAYVPPGPNDIRGPCPGLNAAANHNFLSHDGITTFAELVDAQQNIWNLDSNVAIAIAVLGIVMDGDVVTEKLSIGCDATSRTAPLGISPLGEETGLNTHNKFEGDVSLSRNDYFTGKGDDYSFNGTLFAMMDQTCKSSFDFNCLSLFKHQRYVQSRAENPNFFFGPVAFALFAATTFVYDVFPNYANGIDRSLPVISSWFGATKTSSGKWVNTGERIPPNWYNRPKALSGSELGNDLIQHNLQYPDLIGGNTGDGSFNALNWGSFKDGKAPVDLKTVECLLYQIITAEVPSSLTTVVELPLPKLLWATGILNPIYSNYGCPLKVT